MVSFTGLTTQTAAQGLSNEGATINVAPGCYVVCLGGVNNNSGSITNHGILAVTGEVINPASANIEGNGSYILGGNFVNNGTFIQSAGTTVFNGIITQTISGSSLTTFNNLIIETASAGTTIAAGTMVTVAGSTFNPNGRLTIESDAPANNGSLICTGSGTPAGTVTYNRRMPPDKFRYISLPVSSSTFPSGTFWRWDEVHGYWGEDQDETPTTVGASGIGYTVAASDNTLSFAGVVLNELLDVVATAPYGSDYVQNRDTWGGGGWNLLGNPFPSALVIIDSDGTTDNDFIHHNLSSFDPSYQAIYIYDGSDYDYIAPGIPGYPDGLGVFPGNDIQAGQGFFVLAHHNGVTFDFTSAMRTHNTGVVMTKSAQAGDAWPGFQLKARLAGRESTTLVVYDEEMSAGLDPGYDVGLLSSGGDVEIYTLLSGGGSDFNFARQALPVTEADRMVIPVGIDSEIGGEVTFSAFTIPLGTTKFWLEDRVTRTYTDLNTNSYTVTLPANTYGTGRFYIIASVNTPTGIDQPEADDGGLRIWSSGGRVIIQGEVNEGSLCEIYDIRGSKVLEKRLAASMMNTVDLPPQTNGVIIVKVKDGLKTDTRKIAFIR